jgi:phosphoglycerol transferase MdoB-like AlkP superfamily enzyme
MAGKVKDSLPHALARCGYRNVVFYPMLRRFLGVGKFFESVGLHEIYDAKDQGATLPNERDRFYTRICYA